MSPRKGRRKWCAGGLVVEAEEEARGLLLVGGVNSFVEVAFGF